MWVIGLCAIAALVLASRTPTAGQDSNIPLAFVGVNVVPMDSERVLENQTVVVKGDRIAALGPRDTVAVPNGARVISADGQYLMPGLADMHAHLSAMTQPLPPKQLLRNYLSEGITTVRVLGGIDEDKRIREEVERGEIVGPTIYTAGKTIVGEPDFLQRERHIFTAKIAALFLVLGAFGWLVTWAVRRAQRRRLGRAHKWLAVGCVGLAILGAALVELDVISFKREVERAFPFAVVVDTEPAVRAEVRRRKSDGHDVVKLYDYLSKPLFLAGLDEAKKMRLYTVGHVPDAMTVEEVVNGGLDEVAHIDELMTAHMVGKANPNTGFNQVTFDPAAIARSVRVLADRKTMVVSNLVADEVAYQLLDNPDEFLARPEYSIVSAGTLVKWKTEGRAVDWQGQQKWRREVMQPHLRKVARALHESGVLLLAGTDVSLEGMLPWHLHRELELLVDAGLSPYEALRAATVNAALSTQRAGRAGDFGVVAVGKKADLLLLKQDPLKNVSATRERVGVMSHGRWHSQGELAAVGD